ncbi:MAG: sugar porter family transporter [Parachlamydiales bacterium]|nr:sugar porter family transporter [Parachlamydiales bacterium]
MASDEQFYSKHPSIPEHSGKYKTIVYIICTIAALGGLLFGLDQGFIANALDTIKTDYHLDTSQAENYSAVLATGGVLGALLSGLLARYFGRKKSLIFAGFVFTAGSLISAMLPPIAILELCRFGLGLGVGIASFVVPLYLSETAPAKIRGSMGTLFQLMITIGIFLISLTNVFIAKMITNSQHALPIMFLVIGLFAIVMFIGTFALPESPRWLMLKGKKDKALKVLHKTMNTQAEIDLEIKEIEYTLASSAKEKFSASILFKGYFLKVIIVGVLLQMFQQLVGINVMIYYAPEIFGYAGMKGLVAMMTVPTVNMLFTFPAIYLVEKWGRKKLLYVGAICMFITMVAAGLAFLTIAKGADPATIGSGSKLVLLLAVIVYIFGFAVSWGPVAWLVCSEIFPLKVREVGITITTMVNWTFAGLLMGYSLTFMEQFGTSSLLFLFSFFCILAVAFVYLFVPETKGITLEEIELNLAKGVKLKDVGNARK